MFTNLIDSATPAHKGLPAVKVNVSRTSVRMRRHRRRNERTTRLSFAA